VYQQSQRDEHARVRDFYNNAKPIWELYHHYCIDHSYLDFNDLLIRTVSLLEKNESIKKEYQNNFQYILVDEFQDVNTLQVKLLTYLLNERNQLFCVGDDWQSIYGFRGSNVEYIVKFEKFFQNPKIIKLDINYRSHGTIVEASNQVISHNKFKIDKEIKSLTTSGKKIYLYCAEKESEDGVKIVVDNIDKLLQYGYPKNEILVLSRTRKSEAFDRYYLELYKRKIRVTTIHQSKGLEAKFVFIIGLTRGFQGFPNVRDDDRIFQLIKKSDFELNLEEERRLFYVALTRAKEELFLISEVGNESEFISEIPGEFLDRTNFLILNLENQEPKLCLNCEKKIQYDFIYCPYCGEPSTISDTNKQQNEIFSEDDNK
jgi:DNA helicase-4